MKRLVLVLSVVVPLAACQTTGVNVGSGPLTMSPSVQELFRQYQQESNPTVFAISIDGQSASYRYCPTYADACFPEASQGKVIRECQESSNGVPCKIYAVQNNIVWKGASD